MRCSRSISGKADWRGFRPSSDEVAEPAETSLSHDPTTIGPVIAALLLGFAAAALIDFEAGRNALEDVINSDRVALTAIGLMTSVFLGGAMVAWILKPFSQALGGAGDTNLRGLANSGLYIGWFERAVLFAFLVGGQPEAAAIAFAAKSFAARFPDSNGWEGLPEYFLIGTLASLTIAIAAAVATRAALGIGPF